MLSQYSEEQGVFDEIKKDYDIVVLQDNGNCVSSDEMREKCRIACKKLINAIKETGASAFFYVRPPYGYSSFGLTPLEQCNEFDKLFGSIAKNEGATNICVNRSFAEAMKTTSLKLWGSDNAHTSEQGAYLAVCTMFATIFKTSSKHYLNLPASSSWQHSPPWIFPVLMPYINPPVLFLHHSHIKKIENVA